jgi:DNA-binding NarL/FixJ family response regulator
MPAEECSSGFCPAGLKMKSGLICISTEREEQVLASLAKGHIYKEIADLLNISFETVRTHVRSIYEKLHVHSRTEAVLKYLGR